MKRISSTHKVWFYTQSVIFTLTSVILTRMRVNMTLISVTTIRASVIYAHRVRFHTQSVIYTRNFISTGTNVVTISSSVILTSNDFTRRVWFYKHETLTSVITTRLSVINTHRVRYHIIHDLKQYYAVTSRNIQYRFPLVYCYIPLSYG
jgi:hypothetical protein